MAVSVIQVSAARDLSGNIGLDFVSSVSNGNSIIVLMINQTGTATITAMQDSNGKVFTQDKDFGSHSAQGGYIYHGFNVAGGSPGVYVVNITTSGAGTFSIAGIEISGNDNSGTVLTDSASEGSSTSHNCGATGISGTGIFVGAEASAGSADVTVGSGFTSVFTGDAGVITFAEYKIETGASEKAPYTFSVASATESALAFYPEPGAAGVPFFTQLGAMRMN